MTKLYSARTLVAAMYAAKADPRLCFPTGCWPNDRLTATEFRQWFTACLEHKINRALPQLGRKHDSDYQLDLQCDRRTIDDYTQRRVRNTGCTGMLRTPELRRRYPHINNQPADY